MIAKSYSVALLSILASVGCLLLVTEAKAQQNQGGALLDDSVFRSPQSIDGSSISEPPESIADSNSDSQGQRVFDALFQELDNMIPGDFESGSEQKKAVEDAVTAFQLQNIQRVKSIFEEQRKLDNDFPPANLLLAALSYAIKQAQPGVALLERAAIEDPGYPGVYSAFARLALSQGRVSDALAMFEKCVRITGDSELSAGAKSYFVQQCLDGLIDVAMQQERFDDARVLLEKQRNKLPDNAKVLTVSAELEFRQGNIEKSQEFLQSLKEKHPTTRVPESILASWAQRLGKPDEAEKWIRAAAEKYPDDAQVQLEFASWAVNQEDFPTASSAIIKAEKSDSESLFSRNLKAKIAFCNQAYGVAEAHYRVIAQQQPNNFDAINMHALSLIESKNAEKQKLAREIATRNFRALPDNLVAQAALGYIELKLGSPEQAKTILARAARTAGTAPEIDYFLASLLAQLDEPLQAKMVLESALKHEGIFLYRSAAKKLLKELGSTKKENGSDALPSP